MAGLRQLAERSLRKFAGQFYRMLLRRSGQSLATRFATAEDRFKYIYETNHWDEAESVSGPGSTLEETEPIRRVAGLLRSWARRCSTCRAVISTGCSTDLSGVQYIGGDWSVN